MERGGSIDVWSGMHKILLVLLHTRRSRRHVGRLGEKRSQENEKCWGTTLKKSIENLKDEEKGTKNGSLHKSGTNGEKSKTNKHIHMNAKKNSQWRGIRNLGNSANDYQGVWGGGGGVGGGGWGVGGGVGVVGVGGCGGGEGLGGGLGGGGGGGEGGWV